MADYKPAASEQTPGRIPAPKANASTTKPERPVYNNDISLNLIQMYITWEKNHIYESDETEIEFNDTLIDQYQKKNIDPELFPFYLFLFSSKW